MYNSSKNVDILCKSMRKTMCILGGRFCGIIKTHKIRVENHAFSHSFPYFSAHFSTSFSNLFLTNVFHFSTQLITITTKYI